MKKILTIVFLILLISKTQAQSRYSNDTKQERGAALIIGGVSLTTAALLEGGSSYGTYIATGPKNSNTTKYKVPAFLTQTPRNIMFFAGVTITITGLFTAFHK